MNTQSFQPIKEMGIEQYAQNQHHFHPFLVGLTQRLIENLSSHQGWLDLSPSTKITLLSFQSGKNWKNLKIKEENAKNLLQKFSQAENVRVKWNEDLFLKAMNWAWVWITPWSCLPSGRISSEKVRIGNKKMEKITTTPCFMFLHFQIWGKGILNKPGIHCGNSFDLSTPKGLALLLHEIYHIYQFRRHPLKLLFLYLKSIKDSLVYDKVFFSHARISFEIEAMAFQQEIEKILKSEEWKARLHELKKFR